MLLTKCYCDFGGSAVVGDGVDGADGADSGCVDVVPEPVVLGGGGVDRVVGALDEPLLAVVLLLFQPATIRKPISSNTATPAIQPHIPPAALSSRRITGSLSRGSVNRGSVMTVSSISRDAVLRLEMGKPARCAAGSEISVDRELERTRVNSGGHAHGQPPGGPENKKETRKEHRQAGPSRPLLDGPTDQVGDHHADEDEYDVIREQSHGEGPNQIPVQVGSDPTV